MPVGSVVLDFQIVGQRNVKGKMAQSTRPEEFSYQTQAGVNHFQIPCANALPEDNLLLLKLVPGKTAKSAISLLSAGHLFPQMAFNKALFGPAKFLIETNTNRLIVRGRVEGPGRTKIWLAIGGHPPVQIEISGPKQTWQESLPLDSEFTKDKPFLYVYAERKDGSPACQITNISGESQRGPNDVFK